MLNVKTSRVSSRPGYPQASFVMDFLDNLSPQGRPLNQRVPISWEGLHALQESISVIIDRRGDVGTGQERKLGEHKFTAVNLAKEEDS